ncbi:hypothetical protein Tco_1370551 [Tanacetum coccineum]
MYHFHKTHIEVSDDEIEAPEEASQSPGQAPPSPDYMPDPKHPPSPDYVPGPEEPEQAPLSPDQPLPADASSTALSPGYVADSDPWEDPEEDSEEDHADCPVDGGDDDDDSSDDVDDNDDDQEEEQEAPEEDEEEEHLAPVDSNTLPASDTVPSAEDTEALETDESASTPPPPRLRRTRMSIPSPPLPVPYPPLPLPPPTVSSPTYAEAPLGYKAAGIRLRAASPPTHHPSKIPSPPLMLPSTDHKDDIPEADFLPRKRLCLTTPTGRITDIWDDMVEDIEERAPTMKDLSQRVTDLGTTLARDTHEIYVRLEDAQDDRALHRHTAILLDSEARHAREAWSHSMNYSKAVHAELQEYRVQKIPPKRTAATTTPMTDAQIRALIAQGIADALAEHDANKSRNGDDNHDSGTGGTEGVVGNALTWWNSHVRTIGHEVAYAMTWKTSKKMMTDKYCLRGEIKRLEIELWNLKVKESNKVEKYVGGLPDMIQGSVMASKPKKMQDAIEFATCNNPSFRSTFIPSYDNYFIT